MKNLFKNLMLVAVAAMAFTACSETNDEVNAVTKKVVLEFVADLADDDTRVAFGEKDGNKYPTVWEAGDNVTVKVGEKQGWYTLTEEDVLESGKKAIIRPEFDLVGDETLSGDLVATVNEYVSFDNHQGNEPTISLKAEAVYPATTLTFEHQYAYGKMELVGLPDDFNVTQVELTLVGGGNELNHTISGNNVVDNIFWFTTEAMAAVESFAVYATNGVDTYYREVTVEKAFAFEVGKVSAFRVKDLVVKPADFAVQLTKITSMTDNVIRFEGDNAEDNITISFNPGLETIAAGHYDAVQQDWFNGGEWAWTSATALEVKDEFEGSSVDVNAVGGIVWYYSQKGVDVTVDGDVYTIVAHLKNATSSGNKTVDFTYVGKLEVEEPETPAYDYDITFTKCENLAGNDLTFTNDDGYKWVMALTNPLAEGVLVDEAGNWDGNSTTILVPGAAYPGYCYSGTFTVTKDGDNYAISFITNPWINGVQSNCRFTFNGPVEAPSSSGPDLTGYKEGTGAVVDYKSAYGTVRFTLTYLDSVVLQIYPFFGNESEVHFTVGANPVQVETLTLAGFSAQSGTVDLYQQTDGSYLVMVDATFQMVGAHKFYFYITL